MSKTIALTVEVFEWLGQQGIEPAGAPFIRYHVIDMMNLMAIEIRLPIASAVEGNERVKPGVLPAGQYARWFMRGSRIA